MRTLLDEIWSILPLWRHDPNKRPPSRYFRFLYDAAGGSLSEVARRAEFSMATTCEWWDRFLGPEDRAGGPRDNKPEEESS